MIAGLFAAAVLSGVTSGSSVFRYVSGGTAENEILQILNAILVVTFFLMLAACSMGIFLYLSVHFYRKMYSDEGYLTHTLPVTVHQILISKIIVMVCWILLNALAVLASGVVFGGLVIWGSGQVSPEELAQIAETIGEVLSHIDWTEMATLLLSALLGILYSVLMIVGAMSLGQLASRHRILLSVVAYFGISTLFSSIANAVQMHWLGDWILSNVGILSGVTGPLLAFNMMLGIAGTGSLMMLLGCVVLYMGSVYINSRRLNLE